MSYDLSFTHKINYENEKVKYNFLKKNSNRERRVFGFGFEV